jgi:ribosomal protein L7/L12
MKPLPTLPQTAIDALLRGEKIEAINLTREATGADLRLSAQAVDHYLEALTVRMSMADETSAFADPRTTSIAKQVIEALWRGRKIDAIKLMRQIVDLDLSTAKDIADRWHALADRQRDRTAAEIGGELVAELATYDAPSGAAGSDASMHSSLSADTHRPATVGHGDRPASLWWGLAVAAAIAAAVFYLWRP